MNKIYIKRFFNLGNTKIIRNEHVFFAFDFELKQTKNFKKYFYVLFFVFIYKYLLIQLKT